MDDIIWDIAPRGTGKSTRLIGYMHGYPEVVCITASYNMARTLKRQAEARYPEESFTDRFMTAQQWELSQMDIPHAQRPPVVIDNAEILLSHLLGINALNYITGTHVEKH